jgi:hypothetical protein
MIQRIKSEDKLKYTQYNRNVHHFSNIIYFDLVKEENEWDKIIYYIKNEIQEPSTRKNRKS